MVAGSRTQLADELLNGLALFVEPGGGRPVPPGSVTANVGGPTPTLQWLAPPLAMAARSLVIEVGSAPGLSDVAVANVGNVTTFTANNVSAATFPLARAHGDGGGHERTVAGDRRHGRLCGPPGATASAWGRQCCGAGSVRVRRARLRPKSDYS